MIMIGVHSLAVLPCQLCLDIMLFTGTELYTPLPSHELSLLRSEGQSESGSDWTVWTYTGHHAGPPTNTKVSVVLCGTVATSESVRLENEGECFKPGKEDKFQVVE